MILWVRVGDQDDYHRLDDPADVADHLGPYGIGTVYRCNKYGFESDGFRGQNYISLYWGDADAEPLRELTDSEVTELNDELDRYFAVGRHGEG